MSQKSAVVKRKIVQNIRHIVQAAFFILVAITATASVLAERGIKIPIPNASLHAICPFGGVISFYQLLTVGTLVKKVHESAVGSVHSEQSRNGLENLGRNFSANATIPLCQKN